MDRKGFETYIAEVYGVKPEFLWEKYPDYAVFRHSGSRKWFAVTMPVPRAKLGPEGDGTIDIVNLKCDQVLIGPLRTEPGFFPAYHMNKEYWISVALNGTVAEEKIRMLTGLSAQATAGRTKRRGNWSAPDADRDKGENVHG